MDAVALLVRDHRSIEDLFRRYESLGQDQASERTDVVNDMIRELSIHASIEEQILYPEVKDVLEEGEAMADKALLEHEEAKQALAALDRMQATDPGFDAGVRSLIADVRRHVAEEEEQMLPQLAAALPATTLEDLGERIANTKAFAPMRPLPHAPSEPPGNVVTGVVAASVDRTRDAVSARGGSEASRSKPRAKRTTQRKSPAKRKTTSKRKTATTRGRSPKAKTTTAKRKTTTAKRSRPTPAKARTQTSTRKTRSAASKMRTIRKATRRPSRPIFHVLSDPKGGWRAEREGSSRAVARGDEKRPVVARARELARSNGGRLVIHRANGRIQEQRSYAA